ncbi:MAG TPA: ankyrin repeat domain-containing protein [Sphingomicrobium sp.]|nr:ankyrin repeat domain-containing protein [Sphingomicrobium sp.]
MTQQSNSLAAFVDAIEASDLTTVRSLFESHPEQLHAYTPFGGGTWLHFAAREGSRDVVEYLLGEGIDINVGDRDDATPLVSAARGGHYEVVRYLLECGAVMDTSASVRNPLFAAISGSIQVNATWDPPTGEAPQIVRLFLEQGIDSRVRYNSSTMKNMDALAFAAMLGANDLARIIALWNAQGDEVEADKALAEARATAKSNTQAVPVGEQYRPS